MFEGLRAKFRRVGWKLTRRLEDMRYGLRGFRGLGPRAIRPSVPAIIVAVLSFAIFNLAGGIYDLLEKPTALLPNPRGRGWSFIYPGLLNVQTLNESLVSAMLYILGIMGLYMIFRSVRFAYRPRNAYLLLILGFLITITVIYYSNSLLLQKIGS